MAGCRQHVRSAAPNRSERMKIASKPENQRESAFIRGEILIPKE
jgi:hypothetical protein